MNEFPEESGTITLPIIDCNKEAVHLADHLNLNDRIRVPRCYTKEEVTANFGKIFAQ
ncbi:hypothetical protein X975_22320, partial [Stegodyphus mimosarum]